MYKCRKVFSPVEIPSNLHVGSQYISRRTGAHIVIHVTKRYVLFIFSFIIFNIISCFFFYDDSFAQYGKVRPRTYSFYGSIQLTYDKRWGDIRKSSEFEHDYILGLKGFIIDPRLIKYDVSGDFTQTLAGGEGEDSTVTGKKLNITFLDTLPKKWEKNWMFIPNPISISYSDYSGNYESRNYGISLRYSKPRIRKPKRPGRIVVEEKTPFIPFPTTYFDYDRYEFSSGQNKIVIDMFNLRSTISGRIYKYTLSYRKQNIKGTRDTETDVVEFHPDYKFYDPNARATLEIRNALKYEITNERKIASLGTGINWNKRMDKDVIKLFGRFYYNNTKEGDEKSQRRAAFASAAYTKELSQRMRNLTSLTVQSDKDNERSDYFAGLSDTFTYDLSKAFRGSTSLLIGQNQDGLEYGANVSLSAKARLNATAAYFFAFTPEDRGDERSHVFSVSASGPVVRNLSFTANARYSIRDISRTNNSYSSDSIVSNMNLFYRFGKMTLSFGGGYFQTIEKSAETARNHDITFNSNLSWLIRRNVFLNVFSTWGRDSDDKTQFYVKPRLSFRQGLFSVEAEYDYRRTSQVGIDEKVEHKLFMRLVRRFPSLL